MAGSNKVKIKLEKAIITHDGPADEVEIREPTFGEYTQFGDPVSITFTAEGLPVVVEHNDVIRAYLAKCITRPDAELLIAQGTMRDAMAVKQAFLRFFRPADAEGEGSEILATNSSSAGSAASTPPASPA